jgi:hypothetical protein
MLVLLDRRHLRPPSVDVRSARQQEPRAAASAENVVSMLPEDATVRPVVSDFELQFSPAQIELPREAFRLRR